MKLPLLFLLLYCAAVHAFEYEPSDVFEHQSPVSDFLVSEKYDGIRAIWSGTELVTKRGNPIYAPHWFTASLPARRLDGELWSGRGEYGFISRTVLDETPDDKAWRRVKYMVFDAPADKPFARRYQDYKQIVDALGKPFIRPVMQFEVADNQALNALLQGYTDKGAEGLMLHRKDAPYQGGRSGNVFKLKPYRDAEAIVIAHLPGKGKYTGKLGALLVEMANGIRFKIGTGFSDAERALPPAIGQIVTYRYHGLTENGVPRFASFMRVRKAE